MKFELLIAKRLLGAKNTEPNVKNLVLTKPIINIATVAIALSTCVMIIAMAILLGFQKQIKDKVAGFSGHVIITKFVDNESAENTPIEIESVNLNEIKKNKEIKSIHQFATKAGIIKHKIDIEGVVLKGVGADYDWSFFKSKLISGKVPAFTDTGKSDEILISEPIANKLNYKVGDALHIYFIQQPPRMRKLKVCGIYKSGLEDYDKIFVFADIKHIKKLNDWKPNQTGGFEVILNSFSSMDFVTAQIQSLLPFDLYAQNIREKEPQIFDWLALQDINVEVILILMVMVAGINMITALLVLILEKTPMIGLLKALGSTDKSIRNIFSYQAYKLIGKGLLIGNIIALLFCVLQDKYHLIKLDQESYYVSYVPVELNWFYFTLVNVGAILVCSLMLLVPAAVIAKISPIKAIKFG